MASCNMASAACGFVVTPTNVNSNTRSKITMLTFNHVSRNSGNIYCRRLVVRAAGETSTTTAEPDAKAVPKPPPIGPKRGTMVILDTFLVCGCRTQKLATLLL